MTVGLMALHAIIHNQSRTAFRQLDPELFTDEEARQFDFIREHYHRYGGLPSFEVLAGSGILLPPHHSGVQYHLDALRNRAVWQAIDTRFVPLRQAVSNNDMDTAIALVGEMYAAGTRISLGNDVIDLTEASAQVMDEYALAASGNLQGVTLKWATLNSVTDGIFPGDVLTIVARTGIGKSYLIAAMALAAWRAGHPVLFITMEMTVVQIVRRILAMMAALNPDYLRRGDLSAWGQDAIWEQVRAIPGGPAFHLLSGDFRKRVSDVDNLVQEFAPDCVYIDASYLLDPMTGRRKNASKWESLDDVGEDIKRMALTRNRPVVQTVQFNRGEVKTKKTAVAGAGGGPPRSHVPDLSNIRGTDQIAIVSSLVIAAMEGEAPNEDTRRRLYLLKNRDGQRLIERPIEINYVFDPGTDFSEIVAGEEAADQREAGPLQDPDTSIM